MKLCILGAHGQAGSGIRSTLGKNNGLTEILVPTSKELNLTETNSVREYFRKNLPDIVIMAAGRVGGIHFNNSNQVSQYRINLLMNENVINNCADFEVSKLLLISSSCIYPINSIPPIKENSLFKGEPEETNLGYAIAKLNSIKHIELLNKYENRNWKVLIPANLYGSAESFRNDSHVIPMLLQKFMRHEDNIEVWGDGSPVRQFLYNKDLGSAVSFVLDNWELPNIVNVGTDEIVTIAELVDLMAELMDFKGSIVFDKQKPNGHPNKTIDGSILRSYGWSPQFDLRNGLLKLIESVSQ